MLLTLNARPQQWVAFSGQCGRECWHPFALGVSPDGTPAPECWASLGLISNIYMSNTARRVTRLSSLHFARPYHCSIIIGMRVAIGFIAASSPIFSFRKYSRRLTLCIQNIFISSSYPCFELSSIQLHIP